MKKKIDRPRVEPVSQQNKLDSGLCTAITGANEVTIAYWFNYTNIKLVSVRTATL